jgi:hypothetical protein
MSNKRQSQLLLVRVSIGGFRRFVIPLPIYVLDITLAAFSDLVAILDSLVPKSLQKAKRLGLSTFGAEKISLEAVLNLFLQLLWEVRKYGRLRIVEVQSGKVRVFIDLY